MFFATIIVSSIIVILVNVNSMDYGALLHKTHEKMASRMLMSWYSELTVVI